MIKKDRSITKLISIVNNAFGKEAPIIADHWKTDLSAIGFKKGNKLIYVTTTGCKRNHYFYECEELFDNSDMPYIAGDSDDNVPEEQLLAAMSKFWGIA